MRLHLPHFERVGYVLILTTLITLTLMYFINRRIGLSRIDRTVNQEKIALLLDQA